jgi:hypothetical protein
MFHKSKLEKFDAKFPHDSTGHVPLNVKCWREMKFDHADQDPNEEGISEEEKARRLEYLDKVWWPKVLESVQEEHERLAEEHGEAYMKSWNVIANRSPDVQHGFEPG